MSVCVYIARCLNRGCFYWLSVTHHHHHLFPAHVLLFPFLIFKSVLRCNKYHTLEKYMEIIYVYIFFRYSSICIFQICLIISGTPNVYEHTPADYHTCSCEGSPLSLLDPASAICGLRLKHSRQRRIIGGENSLR